MRTTSSIAALAAITGRRGAGLDGRRSDDGLFIFMLGEPNC
jgi:hypothetical protein